MTGKTSNLPDVPSGFTNDAGDGEYGIIARRLLMARLWVGGLKVGRKEWKGTQVNPRGRPGDFLPRKECGYMRQGPVGNR